MKKTAIGMAIATLLASPAFAASFVNGSFEDGNINGWLAGGGNASISSRSGVSNSALTPAAWLPGGLHYNAANSNSAIIDNTSAYVDPNVGAALGTTVYGGRYSYRVENTSNGGYASAISQTVANYTDPTIFFAWKAVLEAAHTADTAATMKLNLRDDTDGIDLITRTYNATSGGVDPTKFTFSGGNYYTAAWQIEQLNISAALSGHTFTLSVIAADCQPTGHFGYVYLDGFGANIPDPTNNVPEPTSVALLGLGLAGLAASRRRKSV
ncbi:MAG: PEP-CTERM sorting domain-containing protein [Rhodoferax sp.]|uniref:PEP-CTERM sorting domain-containing protein n=1 Tax=Rhodoferax sp. TaxID=50421 RepID=UPI002726BF88|nr:PEP-CTERM sorting domain-containing protein [Rhodoferax sp.]MDO8451092.1 PEP-CTERM sorting domain-containing protein [Rhodoferax sp.]